MGTFLKVISNFLVDKKLIQSEIDNNERFKNDILFPILEENCSVLISTIERLKNSKDILNKKYEETVLDKGNTKNIFIDYLNKLHSNINYKLET